MIRSLHGKWALVTGASSGLGVRWTCPCQMHGIDFMRNSSKAAAASVCSSTTPVSGCIQVAGQQATLYQRLVMMQSAAVARSGIQAMLRGKPSIVPGVINAITAWATRLMPRRLQAAVAYRLMKADASH